MKEQQEEGERENRRKHEKKGGTEETPHHPYSNRCLFYQFGVKTLTILVRIFNQ